MMILSVLRKTILSLRRKAIFGIACGVTLAFVPPPVTAAPEGAFLSKFDAGGQLPEGWRISNFAVGDSHYRTAWSRNAVTRDGIRESPLQLRLYPAPDESSKDFLGGELQRIRRTHFGRYEVVMTAGRGDGVISSFFTYTGPYFGDPHDEIDFEFLGRDTTKVWVNRFAKGEKLPGEWVDLGFDSADGPNIYTLDWLPDRLVWYANGRELLRVEAADRAIPDIPGRIYINIWTGGRGQAGWSGSADDDTESVATYHCISYSPPGEDAPMCSDGDMDAVKVND
ncbi:family 16 glycosylhydrolase [Allosediminivita pacifica]|uniref:Beta-glucanase n=1 Tax=Allosediminivita pacifica TaxID=1267769 RepID=A0A2T6B5D2_9RHOB|nr:family 16 glycosylhydrolase [Allosediminivita pacifica]PTX51291.1 glycosyl hydrolase family 16 [Allosediminivita pacifica]GGA98622.1 beta-glucanase [Allosediminivita pacifica]